MPTLKPPRVSEKVVQSHGVQLLRSIGSSVYVLGTRRRSGDYQGTMQTPGVPDVLAFLPPRSRVAPFRHVLLFWEAKAQGGRLRPEQKDFRALCEVAEVAHIVGDLDAVIAWLIDRDYLAASSVAHYRQPKGQTA